MSLVSQSKLGQSELVTAKKPTKPSEKPKRQRSVRAERIGWGLRDPLTAEQTMVEIEIAFARAEGASPIKAAESLGVRYEQVWGWLKEHPELKARVEAIQARTRGQAPLDREAILKAAKKLTPEEVFALSVQAGIHNPDGTLTKKYGG
jgi:hypothetical protein